MRAAAFGPSRLLEIASIYSAGRCVYGVQTTVAMLVPRVQSFAWRIGFGSATSGTEGSPVGYLSNV